MEMVSRLALWLFCTTDCMITLSLVRWRRKVVAKYEWAVGGAFSDCRGVAILLSGSLAQYLSPPLCISLTIVPTALRIERRITGCSACRLDHHSMREYES